MIFEHPEYLAIAPLAALLFAFTIGAHWRRVRRLSATYEGSALRRLLPRAVSAFPTNRLLFLVGAGTLLGLGIAGPQWFDPEPPEPLPPLDVAIVTDLSLSMTARDASPSRIERAQDAIALITEELPSVRFSLVVYAGWPYVLVPPTDDSNVIRYFLDSLQPEVVQELDRGNALAGALTLANETIDTRMREDARRAVLVVSDGDVYADSEELMAAAAAVAGSGTEIWTAGIGGADGSPLSMEGEAVRDASGRAILSAQDSDLLQELARTGGGRYRDVTDEGGLQSLVADLRGESGDDRAGPAEPFDTTYLFALLAIPLLLWESVVDAGRNRALLPGRRLRQAETDDGVAPQERAA